MAGRLARGGHDVVAWNGPNRLRSTSRRSRRTVGGSPLRSRRKLREMLSAPRHVLISVPSGDATQQMIDQLAGILEPGDVIIDAGQLQLPRLPASRGTS